MSTVFGVCLPELRFLAWDWDLSSEHTKLSFPLSKDQRTELINDMKFPGNMLSEPHAQAWGRVCNLVPGAQSCHWPEGAAQWICFPDQVIGSTDSNIPVLVLRIGRPPGHLVSVLNIKGGSMSPIPTRADEGLSVTVNPTYFWTSQDRVPSPPLAGCIVLDSPDPLLVEVQAVRVGSK